MGFSFNPLWKKLIDKGMTKEDLRRSIETSPSTIAKMGKNRYISMKILDDMCSLFECQPGEIIEYIPEGRGE
ncbi:MAG: helix-turn-helix domain-containing protein [Vulcanimicrobiota bacterium]